MKIKQSAVKAYALECSKAMRAGKFDRVGSDFMENIEAELDNIIRRIASIGEPDRMPLPGDTVFFTASECMPSILEKLNTAIARTIACRVRNHPSLGKTLKA